MQILGELAAVVAVETILGSDPYHGRTVLKNLLDQAAGKPVLSGEYPILPGVAGKRQRDRKQCERNLQFHCINLWLQRPI